MQKHDINFFSICSYLLICPTQLQPPRHGCRQILEVVIGYAGVPHADAALLQLLDVLGGHEVQLELNVGPTHSQLDTQLHSNFSFYIELFFLPRVGSGTFFQEGGGAQNNPLLNAGYC